MHMLETLAFWIMGACIPVIWDRWCTKRNQSFRVFVGGLVGWFVLMGCMLIQR